MLGLDKVTLSLFSVGFCVAMHFGVLLRVDVVNGCCQRVYLIKSLQIDGMDSCFQRDCLLKTKSFCS